MLQTQCSLKNYRQVQSKDIVVCDEVLATVENFRTFLHEQKKVREELVTLSQQPLLALKEELNAMVQQVSKIISGIRRIAVQKDRLKEDLLKEEKNVGLAQRSCEAGHGNFDNNGISQYFFNKVFDFEVRLKSYKTELEAFEENLSSHGRCMVSPRDFMVLLRQIDNEFVCLAANVQTLCDEVKTLKARYLKLTRASGGDCSNPFAEVDALRLKSQSIYDSGTKVFGAQNITGNHSAFGPSPFMSTTSFASAYPSAQNGNIFQSTVIPGAQAHQQPGSLTTAGTFGLMKSSTMTGTSGLSMNAPSPAFQPLRSNTDATVSTSKSISFGLGGAVTTTGSQPFGFPSTSLGFNSATLATNTNDIFGKRLATKP